MTSTLHYIYDPLCGWCYGAAPLIKVAREILPVHAHGGGMMTGTRRQPVTPQLRSYVMQHDQQIVAISGQPFGAAYTDGLLSDPRAVFDSEPPTAAMLAAEQLAGRGLDMLTALQTAHYMQGRRIAESATLIDVAQTLGLTRDAFTDALDSQLKDQVQKHIRQTRDFMARIKAQGFPTLALETDTDMRLIDVSAFMGRPAAFRDWLSTEVGGQPFRTGVADRDRGNFVCNDNTCMVADRR